MSGNYIKRKCKLKHVIFFIKLRLERSQLLHHMCPCVFLLNKSYLYKHILVLL